MKESHTLVNLKAFIESNYENLDLFKKACDKNINLEIYLCIKEQELKRILNTYKEQGINNAKDLATRLVNNQPTMNSNVEVYDKATLLIQKNINNYIKYHGFKMANSAGSAEDWYTEFLVKYWYNVNFYKVRWFYPETLKKQSKVVFKPMLYKDFLYQSKAIISNEKRLKAHQAAKRNQDSIFKTSLDKDFKDSNRNLQDTTSDHDDMSFKVSEFNVFKTKILLNIAIGKHKNLYNKCKKALEDQEISAKTKEGHVILVQAYKLGMESHALYKYIKGLSAKRKQEEGINIIHLERRIKEFNSVKTVESELSYNYDVAYNIYDKPAGWYEEQEKKYAKEDKSSKKGRKKKESK